MVSVMYKKKKKKKKNTKQNEKKKDKKKRVRVLFEYIAGCIHSIPYIFIWREKERVLTQ